jgi:hypothetical protein
VAARSHCCARKTAQERAVLSNLPRVLPVTEDELDLLERELSDFISGLLRK